MQNKKTEKIHLFEEFQEYLRVLNVNFLSPYYGQLQAEGFDINKTQVLNWIDFVKRNSVKFVEKLLVSIQ